MTSLFTLHLRSRAQFPAEAYHCWRSSLHADSQTNTRHLCSTPAHVPGPGVGPASDYYSTTRHHLSTVYLRMPMCERLLALPHCVPVLSAGHTRKSRVTVSSLARFFLFEPVEQDLRAPVTGVCASSPPPPAQIIRGNVATQSLLSL